MYKDASLSAIEKILIVKTSSLGDIVQAFAVLGDLRRRFPEAAIDWAIEENFYSIAAAHPLIRRAIAIDVKGLKKKGLKAWKKLPAALSDLRKEKYDLIFDLQGNTKSGAITLLARGRVKVGFGPRSVREWPNLLATKRRFEVSKQLNIRLQYLNLIQQVFDDAGPFENEGVRFKIEEAQTKKLASLLKAPALQSALKIMVCPGSQWSNKQLSRDTLVEFLRQIEQKLNASFLLVWGAEAERELCEEVRSHFPEKSAVVDKMPIPTWQNLMNEVDLVIAFDSSALHLCGTTATPSFSVFGPTSLQIYKPIGPRHHAMQGACPYGRTFEKVCPILRTCPTGACIRNLNPDDIFRQFITWWEKKTLSV